MDTRREPPAQRQETQPLPVANLKSPKKRVFLAEDHRLVRDGLVAVLEKTGQFEIVGQCGDGLHVVNQVAQVHPEVVVLDVGLPGINGIDICLELRRKLPDTVVLILSMHADEAFIIRALQNGARGYLLKDSAGNDLAEAIQTVTSGQLYIGPGIDKSLLGRLHEPLTDPFDRLTHRERQVLQMIAEGMTNRKIAERLGLSVKTVDVHRTRLMKKLNIHDQTTLVKFYLSRTPDWNAGVAAMPRAKTDRAGP